MDAIAGAGLDDVIRDRRRAAVLTSRFSGFLTRLESSLKSPLPGAAAHARMSPRPPRLWPPDFDQATIRDAAGLLLVFPVDDRPHLVLTVRSETLGRHRGQVSLPGGGVDAGETFEIAALREAREEIGLDTKGVRALGALTPIDIHISGFRLHPIVAAAPARPRFAAAGGEVARIVEYQLTRSRIPGTSRGGP